MTATATLLSALAVGTGLIPGSVAYFPKTLAPTGFLKANGALYSRSAYALLFQALTMPFYGVITSGSSSISGITSTANLGLQVGMPVSGPGIPTTATITAIASTSITISVNATASSSGTIIYGMPFGVGDGSSTFGIPDLRGVFPRGLDDGKGTDTGRVLGVLQTSQNLSHAHSASGSYLTVGGTQYYMPYDSSASYMTSNAGTPGITSSGGTEARPTNMALLACIKY